jgi:hypothetical protein
MKKTVRPQVFETNSSSVHAIAIGKSLPEHLHDIVYFHPDEFGWRFEKYTTVPDRASYLYTAILDIYGKSMFSGEWEPEKKAVYEDWISYITTTLGEKGITCEFMEPRGSRNYYIDHCSDLEGWLKKLRNSKELLFLFLFSNDSEIHTGNDNDEDAYPPLSDYRDNDKYIDVEIK